MTISQLDLLFAGKRSFPARLSNVESAVRGASQVYTPPVIATPATSSERQRVEVNGSFEYADRGAIVPLHWTTALAQLSTEAFAGRNALRISAGGTATQTLTTGSSGGSFVVSFRAKTLLAAATPTVTISGVTGIQYAPVQIVAASGAVVPAIETDGQWYTVSCSGFWASATNPAYSIGSSAAIIIDAVQFEWRPGSAEWLSPVRGEEVDPTAALTVRELSAENIATGTLRVGGDSQANPIIRVFDGTNAEIVCIGTDDTYRGVSISGAAGLRVTGSGSIVAENGLGRSEVSSAGVTLYNGANQPAIALTNYDAKVHIYEAGQLVVDPGGSIRVGDGGAVIVEDGLIAVTDDGVIRAGDAAGPRAELRSGGLSLWQSATSQTLLLSAQTGKAHIVGDAFSFDTSGRISMVQNFTWVDQNGFWSLDNIGNAAFAVSAADAQAWGGDWLDRGDVLIGTLSRGVFWDASAQRLKVSGEFQVSSGSNTIWINDANDGAINVGGVNKATAPFRVASDGYLQATGAAITGTISNGNGTVSLSNNGLTLRAEPSTNGYGYGLDKTILWKTALNADAARMYATTYPATYGASGNILSFGATDWRVGVLINSAENYNSTATVEVSGFYDDYDSSRMRVGRGYGHLRANKVELISTGLTSGPYVGSGIVDKHTLTVDGTNGVLINGVRIDTQVSKFPRLDWLNQDVKTTANPTFGRVYANADFVSNGNTGWASGGSGGTQGFYWADDHLKFYGAKPIHMEFGGLPLDSATFAKITPFRILTNGLANTITFAIMPTRTFASTGWDSVDLRIQRIVDVTEQGFLAIGGANGARFGFNVNNPPNVITLPNTASVDGRGLANAWNTYSSRRWKEDIQPFDTGRALAALDAFEGVTYLHKDEPDSPRQAGFIAEDVAAAGVPEVVTFDEEGQPNGLFYDRIPALHHQVLRYLVAEVHRLRERLDGQ